MRGCTLLGSLLASSLGIKAQHVHYEPQEVQIFIHSQLEQFASYTKYSGPSPTAKLAPSPTTAQLAATDTCSFWLEDIKHQGVAAFNSDPESYQVFRNVKDFGAKGDGVTDDTAAINSAISSGNRCAPGSCQSTTVTPAVVYLPAGVYMVNSSIIDYYYTQIIGNPNCMPTIRAFSTFQGSLGMIDADPYQSNGNLAYGSTNVFWRQIRNIIVDTTLVPASSAMTGIHWPTAQATSLQNVVFNLNSQSGTQHQGIFIESGSGGFMNDLVFNGGLKGAVLGNQQFTMRNLTFNGCITGISQIWDWGWTYQGINFNNCTTGLDMSSGGTSAQSVGSVTMIDSSFKNTKLGIATAYGTNSQPPAAGSLILENVAISNVPVIVRDAGGTALAGTTGSTTIAAWGEGHSYTPNGPHTFQGSFTPVSRPSSLVSNTKYYTRSKPQYQSYPVSSFLSARSEGATGNGHTDDTAALQKAIDAAISQNKILFVDQGNYLVSNTIYIPAGSKIVGESYSVILSSGSYFDDMSNPQPVVQIGKTGETGFIEWSDMIVSTQGPQAGAVLFEYNLQSPTGTPSGIWDVHSRIGGFAGSDLQLSQCPTTPNTTVTSANYNRDCVAAFMAFHITKSSTGLYMENNWLWTADHDVEDPSLTQITIYAGRGLLDESAGPVWLYGTAVEHHTLYQYQFAGAKDVFAGQIQTETPYYQPNPSAPVPFSHVASLNDPVFTNTTDATIPTSDAWGLRIVNSSAINIYGAGLYSFFNNYSTSCSNQGNGETCQNRVFEITSSTGLTVYNLNTVGVHYMIEMDGDSVAYYNDNLDGFVDTIALFRTAS
ncbi:glycoside hydrolase family 55 protein [Teratosphaeria destructans]|uniref:Glycoside hydrolase family 55 protein n=1 Tax=Teratosphaeria destructans TaxID=418781 RepID=A0A9W7SSS8_9PEZI|nr:glycoside hydrolase family 55 protein [Teratosphaeria destructans]